MNYFKTGTRLLLTLIFVWLLYLVVQGTTNSLVYWVLFTPVKIIQKIVAMMYPAQGAAEISSLVLGAPLTAFYWYFVFDGMDLRRNRSR